MRFGLFLNNGLYSFFYSPGNSDHIEFRERKNEKIAKSTADLIEDYQIDPGFAGQFITENLKDFKNQKVSYKGEPFYLLISPFTNDKLKNELIKAAGKKLNDVRIVGIDLLQVYAMITLNRLPAVGTVLFIEADTIGIHVKAMKVSADNKFPFNSLDNQNLVHANLPFQIPEIVARLLVEPALLILEPENAGNTEVIERETENTFQVARDILNELQGSKDWNSVETTVTLTNGKKTDVVVYREDIQKEFIQFVARAHIESPLKKMFQKYAEANIVLHGEAISNPIITAYLERISGKEVIVYNENDYRIICETLANQAHIFDKRIKKPETKTVEKPRAEVTSGSATVRSAPGRTKGKAGVIKEPAKIPWAKILIPLAVILALFLAYIFFWPGTGNKKEVAKETTSKPLIHEVNKSYFEFASTVNDTQTLSVISTGPWKIDSVPEWIQTDISNADSSKEIKLFTAHENDDTVLRKHQLLLSFDDGSTKSVEIAQMGKAPEVLPPEQKTEPEQTEHKKEEVAPEEPVVITKPVVNKLADSLLTLDRWDFKELDAFINSIRNTSYTINNNKLNRLIDPSCEVFIYIDNEKTSSEKINVFLDKIMLGLNYEPVPGSIEYGATGKIIAFGQEKIN